jgi:hypothetical protein
MQRSQGTCTQQNQVQPSPIAHPRLPLPSACRLDALERHRWHETEVLDALKLESFQGFYNLSALLLAFSLLAAALSGFRQRGLLVDPRDFTCPEAARDLVFVASILPFVYAQAILVYLLTHLWSRNKLGWLSLVLVYVCTQVLTLLVPVAAIYLAEAIAPLPAASVVMCTLIVQLKMHSYVMTNYAIARELHEKGTLRQRVDLGLDDTGSTGARAAPAAVAQAATEPQAAMSVTPRAASARSSRVADAEEASEPQPEAIEEEGAAAAEGSTVRRRKTAPPQAGAGGEAREPAPATAEPHIATGGEPGSPASPAALSPERADDAFPSLRGLKGSTWPESVSFLHYLYFLAAPTLVYEPRYPRTKNRRWGYICVKLLQAVACGALQYVVLAQFALPIVREPTPPSNLLLSSRQGYLFRLLASPPVLAWEAWLFDIIRLAIPSLILWLTSFYAFFHCVLNIVAELLRHADRDFYRDWWNSTEISSFWRKWNVPVHEWALRHVVLEGIHYGGATKQQAVVATFFVSAIAHELIFSVAFRTVRPYFFLGMLAQLPLIWIGQLYRTRRRGNFVVWLSLFIGQPLLELAYARDYIATHKEFFCVQPQEKL